MSVRGVAVLGGLLITVGLVGCGSTSSAVSASKSVPTPSSSATTVQSSSALASSSPATVATGTATVKGKAETVLTTANGMTLYYFTADTPTHSACTGKCASIWPPLTTSATSIQVAGVPGAFSIVADSLGNQVAYNGHLLYTYSLDKAPGQALGEGVLGKWFVATPSLAAAATVAASSSSASTGY